VHNPVWCDHTSLSIDDLAWHGWMTGHGDTLFWMGIWCSAVYMVALLVALVILLTS